jgi:hypothetical protein
MGFRLLEPGEPAATEFKFRLQAEDSKRQRASFTFVIVMIPAFTTPLAKESPNLFFNHAFSLTLSDSFKSFLRDYPRQLALVQAISSYLGDTSSEQLWVRSITKGSTVVKWSNTSLFGSSQQAFSQEGPSLSTTSFRSSCPIRAIEEIARKIVGPKGEIRKRFAAALQDFQVRGMSLELTGACAISTSGPHSVASTTSPRLGYASTQNYDIVNSRDDVVDVNEHKEGISTDTDMIGKQPSDTISGAHDKDGSGEEDKKTDDLWLTTIIPVCIMCVLLIASVSIAVWLWGKNRRSKKLLGHGSNGSASTVPLRTSPVGGSGGGIGSDLVTRRSQYVSKGPPVVFPNEVCDENDVDDDEREPSVTTPMLIKEDRPPLPIPEQFSTPAAALASSSAVTSTTTTFLQQPSNLASMTAATVLNGSATPNGKHQRHIDAPAYDEPPRHDDGIRCTPKLGRQVDQQRPSHELVALRMTGTSREAEVEPSGSAMASFGGGPSNGSSTIYGQNPLYQPPPKIEASAGTTGFSSSLSRDSRSPRGHPAQHGPQTAGGFIFMEPQNPTHIPP